MRVRLDFAYDGTDFSGWAAQPGLRTVEGELGAALARILRAVVPPALTVAGRTDAGVHARGAVAHVDVDEPAWLALPGRSDLPPERAAVRRLAGVLPPDIAVRTARVVPEEFDARFSAVSRRYTYRICDAPELLDPLRRRDTVSVRRPLDAAAMDEAAARLVGLRDFAAFCKRREGATTVRTLLEYSWRREGHLLTGTVLADAFCHSMVRALVGAVVPVGEGRKPVTWPAEVAEGLERDPGVVVMPAHGLCLEEVAYPPEGEFAARARTARAVRTLPGETTS
ncbi:tRNA pseudouridine(38-40) synthase TruA [Mobilicoccus caccae]|uniref:tRNA pseudouridine synthase A n=1 Tax=Mobilicoccus caccae TaxID=1859295 RepID=A0ABQ6IRJ7_9MICO|nr:tRNA pseudouridine(38-40) synthase TruA [Mobilicoccus caccae]GMA40527.1 tRNA pseudouridine synthase A [Mobilicoccus caccae]